MRHTPLLCGIGGFLLLCGCSLFTRSSDGTEDSPSPLREVVALRDAVELEVLFVERPLGDPALDSEIWSEVDQISALPVETRAILARNGFRIGVGGSQPGPALGRLLASAEPKALPGSREEALAMHGYGHRFMVRSGAETQIQVTPVLPELTVELPTRIGGKTRRVTFDNARCVLQLRVKSLQKGWSKIVVTPEIHHGTNQMRRIPVAGGWQLKNSQEIERLYPLRFELDLSVGEMGMLSLTEIGEQDSEDTPGYRFFVGTEESEGLQKLLVIRLADADMQQRVFVTREDAD